MKNFQNIGMALIAASLFIAQDTNAKPAKCDVSEAGNTYKGPCEFEVQDKGSFVLTRKDGRSIIGYADIGVFMEAPGVGVVQYHSDRGEGRYGFLGNVRRSTKDKACWIGSEYKVRICVY